MWAFATPWPKFKICFLSQQGTLHHRFCRTPRQWCYPASLCRTRWRERWLDGHGRSTPRRKGLQWQIYELLNVMDFSGQFSIELPTMHVLFLPLQPKVERNCFFTPVCLSDSKSYGQIRIKLGGQVGCVTRKNWFVFGGSESWSGFVSFWFFSVILHHWEMGPKDDI